MCGEAVKGLKYCGVECRWFTRRYNDRDFGERRAREYWFIVATSANRVQLHSLVTPHRVHVILNAPHLVKQKI